MTAIEAKYQFSRIIKIIGPGVITGAADDDPSGIATYTQTGAQFGYAQLWTALFMLPFMIAVQECCGRIGMVTGKGIGAVVRDHYNRSVLYFVVFLVVVANTINIGADIGAMAAAAQLLLPVHFVVLTVGFTALMLVLVLFTSYRAYSRILKWLVLGLTAYVIEVIIVGQPWEEVVRAAFIPRIELSFDFLFIITAVLGTTISPYLFFWQASEEVEEEIERHEIGPRGRPHLRHKRIDDMRLDTAAGMFASEVATWSIIVVAATVLNRNGITDIRTAADAAKALEPLVQSFPNAGSLAKVIFASGIIALGLLAVPVLAGSAAYALSEALRWKEGLYLDLKRARGFHLIIIGTLCVGLVLNFTGIDPVKALVYAAVINGVTAVPLLFIITRIGRSRQIMGKYRSGTLSNVLMWLTFVGMGAAAVGMFATLVKS